MSKLLRTLNLTIGYKKRNRSRFVVAEGINVNLKSGEFVCLLGPNGAGKSTLLRTLAGLQKPISGDVMINGTSIYNFSPRDIAKHLSIVLTDRPSIGFIPVFSVVALGRYPYTNWTGSLSSQDEEIVWRAIRAVGIEDLANRLLSELSDGERQKVMIARALAQEPKIMILDEATAFLDLPRRVELMLLLRKLANESNIAVLLSTHDLDLALRSADRLWILPKGGSIIAGIPEDLVLNGAFSAAFDGSNVVFDKRLGTFVFESPERGRVVLESSSSLDDVVTAWTCRALTRAGYVIVSDEVTPLKIKISNENGSGTVWRMIWDGKVEKRACSLEDLISKLGSMANVA
ncbi:MAG: ABC transporter ATP-binding protein [Syntrophobacterales bacterium]|nr:ABC transporter ATP-binding protein [Syntrophobacterales bacterium]